MSGTVTHMPGAAGELMPEKAVLKQWPCLSLDGLRAARAAGIIGWVKGKRGSAWYRPDAVREYIKEHLERPCQDRAPEASLNSAVTGLPKSPSAKVYTLSGLTPEMVERAGEASALRILNKQS